MWNEYAEWCSLRNARFDAAEWPELEAEAYEVLDEDAKRVLAMPRQLLNDCTWVLNDADGECMVRRGRERSGWQGQLRADLRSARYGFGPSNAQDCCVQELANSQMRPLSVEGLDEEPRGRSPLEQLALQEEAAWALHALSPRQQEAIGLKAEGLSRKQMADAMGCSEKAVKKALEEGRARAKKLV